LFIFAGLKQSPKPGQHKALSDFAQNLTAPDSFYTRFGHNDNQRDIHHDSDNPHSRFFSLALILAAKRPEIEISDLPALFQDYAGKIYADDRRDIKVLEAKAAAHAKVGLEGEEGAVVVVRPDGHVGVAVRLVEGTGTVEALDGYFKGFIVQSGLGGGAVRVKSQL